jgi:hypothetical protein
MFLGALPMPDQTVLHGSCGPANCPFAGLSRRTFTEQTTAFLILRGEFHGRHYDRVEDEKEHYIIKPTIDRKFTLGECSTISDDKDNVHWFQATSDTGFIFNIHVLDVRPGTTEPTGRVYLDPNGEKLKDGMIRARRLNYKEVHELYG